MEDSAIYKSLIEEPRATRKPSSLPPARLLFAAILVSLGGPFNFGYQLLVTNPAQEAFLQFLNDSHFKSYDEFLDREQLEDWWSLIVSIFFWGSTAGAFLIRVLSEEFGRKSALQISHALQIVACALTIFSFYQTSAVTYAVARFLLGLSITISLGIAPMFITECRFNCQARFIALEILYHWLVLDFKPLMVLANLGPKECRGVTSMTTGLSLQIALVVGAILAMPQLLGTIEDWWKLYAVELAITLHVMLFVPFIHDSPEYLHKLARKSESQRSLSFYHNVDGQALEAVLKQLDEDNSENQQIGLISLWKDPNSRRGTLIGSVVMVSMTMSGIAAVNAFSFEILLSTGLSVLQASIGNVIICVMSVVGILLSSFAIDRLGRRLLLLSTYGLLAVINAIIAGFMYGFEYSQSSCFGYPLLVTICLFNLAFAAGPGPVSLFITGELVGQNARGAACTWGNVFMCLVRSILVACYLPLKNLIGQTLSYFLLFFPPMVVTVVLLYFFLPETKGKTASQVQEEWMNLSTLRSKKRSASPSPKA